MHNPYDYQKFGILYVDDEELSLKAFRRMMEGTFKVYTASNAEDGFKILEQQRSELALIISDQRMPGEKGVQLLERARQLQPKTLRILATAYADIDAAIDAVNAGAIYKYITKPWDPPMLETTIKRAIEFFIVQRERDQLLREKLTSLHNLMITDRVIALGVLASGLGHYVRNSMVAVQTFIELAPSKLREENVDLDQLRQPGFWRDFYGHVQAQVRRIGTLLSGLESAAATPGFQFQDEVRPEKLIQLGLDAVQSELVSKRIQVTVRASANLPVMKVDVDRLQRLFELILRDEAMTLPEASQIEITADLDPEAPAGGTIRFEVRDNGPGLPRESLRAVFDPFFVRNQDPQAFGLNLMTAYFVVYHHGGTIRIDDSGGDGTRFVIRLPIHTQAARSQADEGEFLARVLLNDNLWDRILATA